MKKLIKKIDGLTIRIESHSADGYIMTVRDKDDSILYARGFTPVPNGIVRWNGKELRPGTVYPASLAIYGSTNDGISFDFLFEGGG